MVVPLYNSGDARFTIEETNVYVHVLNFCLNGGSGCLQQNVNFIIIQFTCEEYSFINYL